MGYSRRWRPNAQQKREYAERMREQEQMSFERSSGAIREGCKLTWVDKSTSEVMTGTVVTSSYGATTGQHTFTIETRAGKKMIKGRNLYDRLLKHEPGDQSKMESK